MKISYELTEAEFKNLKNGLQEGLSNLGGHFFSSFGREAHQKQVEAVKNGDIKKVFFFEHLVNPLVVLKESSVPEITMMVVQATIVPETEEKDIDLDLVASAEVHFEQ